MGHKGQNSCRVPAVIVAIVDLQPQHNQRKWRRDANVRGDIEWVNVEIMSELTLYLMTYVVKRYHVHKFNMFLQWCWVLKSSILLANSTIVQTHTFGSASCACLSSWWKSLVPSVEESAVACGCMKCPLGRITRATRDKNNGKSASRRIWYKDSTLVPPTETVYSNCFKRQRAFPPQWLEDFTPSQQCELDWYWFAFCLYLGPHGSHARRRHSNEVKPSSLHNSMIEV